MDSGGMRSGMTAFVLYVPVVPTKEYQLFYDITRYIFDLYISYFFVPRPNVRFIVCVWITEARVTRQSPILDCIRRRNAGLGVDAPRRMQLFLVMQLLMSELGST